MGLRGREERSGTKESKSTGLDEGQIQRVDVSTPLLAGESHGGGVPPGVKPEKGEKARYFN